MKLKVKAIGEVRNSPRNREVLDKETGIYYNSVREAYKAKGFNYSIHELYERLRGKVPNDTGLTILDGVNKLRIKVVDKSCNITYDSISEAARALGTSDSVFKYRIKNNVLGFKERFELI